MSTTFTLPSASAALFSRTWNYDDDHDDDDNDINDNDHNVDDDHDDDDNDNDGQVNDKSAPLQTPAHHP